METIKNKKEVLDNLYRLYKYSFSENQEEKDFYTRMLKKGWVFVAENIGGEILFAPSKFAGYSNNSNKTYFENKDNGADGRDSNKVLSTLYGSEVTNDFLLEKLKTVCKNFGIDRNFETEKTIRFYFDEHNVSRNDFKSYFICPTHIGGAKPKAWTNFKEKEIASIGWNIPDYTGWEWEKVKEEIVSKNYENQNEAIKSHSILYDMQVGDIICCTNNNHGLFGVGVVASDYKYQQGIHNAGTDDENEWYNHYVDVVWLLTDFIPKNVIQKKSNETYWEPYGTLSEKEFVPSYIKNLLFKNTETQSPSTINTSNMHPLNTILYGPPGTGKTYHTITKAVEIIEGESFANRYQEAKELYKEKLAEEQIEFVTFHQNYSYEDFVAGLRPNTTETNHLSFKEHKGIFYRISQKAKENWEDYQQYQKGNKFKEPSFEEVLNEFLKPLAERDEPIVLQTLARNVNFKIFSINEKNFGLEKSSGNKDHTISFTTLKALYEGKREYNLQGLGVYYYPLIDKLKQIAKTLQKEITEVKILKYVLIIDEINRANISRVFGELITLLEPDKRLGEKHELTLRLPGLPDDERFGVPPNLYIVATMNTADKSIALIDIAIRRRFVFEDMYPRPEIINTTVPEAYRNFLINLNTAIKDKKGVDFTIGHAYFIPDAEKEFNIVQVLNQKVIPLLNEYFYNQRNNIVFNLLSPLQSHLPNIVFEQDEFIGVKAKAV